MLNSHAVLACMKWSCYRPVASQGGQDFKLEQGSCFGSNRRTWQPRAGETKWKMKRITVVWLPDVAAFSLHNPSDESDTGGFRVELRTLWCFTASFKQRVR